VAGTIASIHIHKGVSGVFICNPESDTVFLYRKEKPLTPVICKTPLANDLDPKVVLNDFTDIGRYQFIRQQTMVKFDMKKGPLFPTSYYGYDKQTREIFTPSVSLPDYDGHKVLISSYNTYFEGKKTVACFNMDLYQLKEAYKENRLNGKLKELVATLDENKDNEVYAIAIFK
jgi:hypothetical protein